MQLQSLKQCEQIWVEMGLLGGKNLSLTSVSGQQNTTVVRTYMHDIPSADNCSRCIPFSQSSLYVPRQPICIERVLISAIKYESLVLPPLFLSPRISRKVQCRLSLTEKVNVMSLICFCFANDTISLFCQSHGHLPTFLWFF